MKDLWPTNIANAENKVSPMRILKEQAALLGRKTQNIVKAKVLPEKRTISKPITAVEQPKFQYSFYIVAPVLENYQYRLFTIYHDIELYPVNLIIEDEIQKEIFPEKEEQEICIYSEDEFLETLKKIFSSSKTTRLIQAILVQSGKS